MVLKSVTAVCDACVLYPFHLRNVLVQASVDSLYEARWTDEIHDEWTRNLIASIPEIPPERLQSTRKLMEMALPAARISGFQHHIQNLRLPDLDDRHVVAAAIEAKATHILTWNLRDFPPAPLKKHGLIRQTPDAFLVGLYDQAPDLLITSLANARSNLSKSGMSGADFIDTLHGQKLIRLAEKVHRHVDSL
jgi:hypothetical protein